MIPFQNRFWTAGISAVCVLVSMMFVFFTFTIEVLAISPNWTGNGENEYDQYGASVSSAGDVNGDGYGDIIVGVPGCNNNTGKVYVYLGSPSGLSATPSIILTGEAPGDLFGASLSSAGDVNGDGYDDVIVGAPGYNTYTGKVYVYLGSPSGLSATPSIILTGEAPWDFFGASLSSAGDVNGDGYGDIIVGAWRYQLDVGRAFVYLGSPSGLSATPSITLTGEAAVDAFGRSVSSAGDVNGDGYGDVIVGAPSYMYSLGKAYVYLGSPSGLSATPSMTLTGEAGYDYFASSVSSAGDVNGDGYDDVIVGAPNHWNSSTGKHGKVYVYLGSPSRLSATPSVTLTGEADVDAFGSSVSSAGDVNGDGYDDVIVGAPGNNTNTGKVFVYLGSPSGLRATPSVTITGGEVRWDFFGTSLSSSFAGDVNGDGYDDVIVGAYKYNNETGRAYVYHGSPPPSEYLPLVRGTTWKYLEDGEQTVTRKVLNKKVDVGGVATTPVKFIEENVTEYLTSDSNGMFLHRQYQPHVYVSGVGWVDIDVTFIPPIKLADGAAWIGQSFHSEGTAKTLIRPLGKIYDFYYTADSTIEAEETVTVPAGTFDTIRYRESVTIYGLTLSMTRYLARGIGIVKDVATDPQGKTSTVELVSYLVGESNPPTGSMTINGGAEATKRTAVTLTLTASDNTPGAIRMCISNAATCKAWTAFAATKSWTLTTGNGNKTVNVWLQDMWGNVNATPYSGTIILDTMAPANGTVTATPGDAQVTLDWTGFTDTGSGIGSYKVVSAKGAVPLSCSTGTMIYSGTETSYIHMGLTNGTKYGYRVCAIDKAGNVSTGATASAKPKPESNPPTGSITINGGAEATKRTAVTLTLTASDDTPAAIRMCISNTATCKAWTAFAATKRWTLTTGNGNRTVNVWLQDMWGNVNATPYSGTIILDTIAPANGTVTATPGDAQVTLDWTGFTDTGSGIGSYKVVSAKGAVPLSCSTGTMIYSGTETSYIHMGLTNGAKYGYRVCAIDKAGNVSTGATASAKPKP